MAQSAANMVKAQCMMPAMTKSHPNFLRLRKAAE